MPGFPTLKKVNRAVASGSRFLRGRKYALIRFWRRAILLPEAIVLSVLLIFGGYASQHFDFHGGQQALASANTAIQEGVPVLQGQKRKTKALRERLHRHPDHLLRLSGSDVTTAFNAADLQRSDGGMTILQFRGEQCILDIFLNGQDVVHYESRMRQSGGESRMEDCIEDIMRSRKI